MAEDCCHMSSQLVPGMFLCGSWQDEYISVRVRKEHSSWACLNFVLSECPHLDFQVIMSHFFKKNWKSAGCIVFIYNSRAQETENRRSQGHSNLSHIARHHLKQSRKGSSCLARAKVQGHTAYLPYHNKSNNNCDYTNKTWESEPEYSLLD